MTFQIITNGCEATQGNIDTVRRSVINELGLFPTEHNPDIVIMFPCTFNQQIRNDSDLLLQTLFDSHKDAKRIFITGCFLDTQFSKIENVHYAKYGTLIENVRNFVHSFQYQKNTEVYTTSSPFVEISRGCYGACTFCSIVSVKGKHTSESVDFILKKITELEKQFHTIKLVGDEVAGYGKDTESSLEILISTIFKRFPNLQLELGQLNPNILKDWNHEDYEFLSDPRIVGSIHLPLQSASNTVLKKMNRFYTIEQFKNIYKRISAVRKNDKISTDIIIGFPGETEEDHEQNIQFLQSHPFDFYGVFMFDKTDRKTPAGRMADHVENSIVQRRYEEIMNVVSQFKKEVV